MDLPLVFSVEVAGRGDKDLPYRWDDDYGALMLQAVRYPELWRNDGGFDVDATMWSWTIDPANGTVEERQLDDRSVEFPRIDDRLVGLPVRYSVTVDTGSLVRYDLDRDTADEHRFGNTQRPAAPGEAVFVPAGQKSDELAGWYLPYVYDPKRDGSDLVIIDASDFTGKPAARVRLPQRVPHGCHGNWITG